MVPTPLIDQSTSKINDLLKSGLTKIGASTSLLFNAMKVVWHMGVQKNLQCFFVNANSESAILAYPTMNLL
jgi:hypothetical protein